MITLKNVTKRYGDCVILESADYTFPQKGIICLLGPSGGGKTTLLNLIAGFDTDYEGEITVGELPLTGMTTEMLCAYRREFVGFVFQNYHLLPGYSALENVMLAAELSFDSQEESRQKAEMLLKKLGLGEKMNQMCETLSGGQKQRVAIARALLGNPKMLLCDEPTGALDRKTSAEIMELLREIAQEKPVVVITHDQKLIPFADELLRMEDHKLISEHHKPNVPCKISMPAPTSHREVSTMKRAVKNFKVHAKRYLAAGAALAVGLTAFLCALSFGNVMDLSISKFQKKNTALGSGYIKGMDDGTVRKVLEADTRIENVYHQYPLEDITLTLDGHREILDEKLPLPKAEQALSYGVMPRREENEISLTPSLAKKFAKDIQTLPGKSLILSLDGTDYTLTVSGIYNAAYDDFFVSSDVEQQLFNGRENEENYSVSYEVKAFEDIVAVSNTLKLQGIAVQDAAKEVSAMQETFRTIRRLFLIVSALVLLAALLLCTILLFRLQNTRYREIGLLSALGFRAREISAMIYRENRLLAGLAAGLNAVLAGLLMLVCRIAGSPLIIGIGQLIGCTLAAFLLILLLGRAASARLLRSEPAEALRR